MAETQPSIVAAVRERVAKVVVGQHEVVDRLLIALFTGGHLLLEGVPGIGKTLLVVAVARAVNLAFGRVQFTIDMLPSDIIGSELLDQQKGEFRTHKGPIFTNLLLADEINRAAPKVQSALLEAMQERKVTIGDRTHVLPAPFLVIATQNPIEQSGTFELPEAQLDRFMLCHRQGYPTSAEEEEILNRQLRMGLLRSGEAGGAVPMTAFDTVEKDPCCDVPDLTRAMEGVQRVHVSEVFKKHCVELVGRTRKHPDVEIGGSPRAGLALVQASRARAFVHGRDYVTPEDLFALADDVLLHRMRLTYGALAEGKSREAVLKEIVADLG